MSTSTTPSYPGRSQGQFNNDFAFAAIKADGSVVTWGNSDNGGDSSAVADDLTNVQLVCSSGSAFAALKSDGSVIVWGSSNTGGDSSAVSSDLDGSIPVSALYSTETAFAALRVDGSVITWGESSTGGDSSAVSSDLDGADDIISISSNISAFAAIKDDGSVVTWGYSDFGGDSSSVSASLDGTIAVTEIFSTGSAFAALREDGSVITWGTASDGGDSTGVAGSIDGTVDVTEIFATTSAFAALRTDGSIITWGDASNGGDSTAVAGAIDGTLDVIELISTDTAFAALHSDGSVTAWGDSTNGGDSSSVASDLDGTDDTKDITQVYSNGTAFAALRVDGSVITWGYGPYGGDQSAVSSELDGTTDVTDIIATEKAFAALRADGSVITWGSTLDGGNSDDVSSDLDGTTSIIKIFSTSSAFAALKEDGTVVTWGDVEDGGDSSSVAADLTSVVGITGVTLNTAPDVTPPTTVTYTDTSADDSFADTTETLTVTDADNDTLLFMFDDGSNAQTGTYGSITLDRDTGEWTYSPDDVAIEGLKTTESDVFTVIVTDGAEPITTTITIDLEGVNDDSSFSGDIIGTVTEDETLTASGTLTVSDLDTDDIGFVSQTDTAGTYGTLSIDTAGEWSYTLDNDSTIVQELLTSQSVEDVFTVSSAGGSTQDITITVNGQNDLLDLTDHTLDTTEDADITSDTVADVVATYAAADGQESISGLTFNDDGTYSFDPSDEDYDYLEEGENLVLTFDYTAVNDQDEVGTATLTITVVGINDLPILDEEQSTLSTSFTDTNAADHFNNATGTLVATDAESDDLVYFLEGNISSQSGTYGVFTVNNNTGDWTYIPDDDDINGLKENASETFTVLITDGTGFIETDITINLEGTNDDVEFTGNISGDVTEDLDINASGSLLATDRDFADIGVISLSDIEGTYGTFSIDSDGDWTYNLNNNDSIVQDLTGDQTVRDIFSAISSDGTTQDITISITGNNDDLLLSNHVESLTENGETVEGSVKNLTAIYTPSPGQEDIAGLIFNTDGSYSFDPNDSAYDYLEADETLLITFDFTATNEHNETGSADLLIIVTGINDLPILDESASDLSISYTDTSVDDAFDIVTGALIATDADANSDENLVYFIDETGDSKVGTYGTLTMDTNTGQWTYTPNDEAIEALQEDASETFSVRVTDGIALDDSEITINISAANDTSSFSGDVDAELIEDNITSVSKSLIVSDRDLTDAAVISQAATQGIYGTFTINESGQWSYLLNNGTDDIQSLTDSQRVTDTFNVVSIDGQTQEIIITVTGSDDATVFSGDLSGTVTEDATITSSGTLSFTGIDSNDQTLISQTDVAGTYGSFSINTNGQWSYNLDNDENHVQALTASDAIIEEFEVSTEGGDTQTVSITVIGQDDDTNFSGDMSASVSEDGTTAANGILTTEDGDSNDANIISQTAVTGTYGDFSINSEGQWSYSLDNNDDQVQSLAASETVTDIFTVETQSGETQDITISITGKDDPTTISGNTSAAVKEDGTTFVDGILSVTDIDSNEAEVVRQSNTSGDFGSFSVTSSGAWNYTLNNSSSMVQGLSSDETVIETFTVETEGGETQDITITLTGENDTTSFSGDISASVSEDETITATGILNVEDADNNDANIISQTETSSTYGNFSITSIGQWTYTLNNDSEEVQDLLSDETVTDTLTVETEGGEEQTITITITGQDDEFELSDISLEVSEGDTVTTGSMSENNATYSAVDGQEDIPGFVFNSDGSYSFDPTNSTYDSLAEGETVDLSFEYQGTNEKNETGKATINIKVTGTNDAPVISSALSNLNIVVGSSFSYLADADTFLDTDNNDDLAYESTLSNGDVLPSWLSFDAETLAFSGLAENNEQDGLTVRVTATDGQSESISDEFTINIADEGEQIKSTIEDDLISGGDGVDTALVSYLPGQYDYSNGILSGAEGNDTLVKIEYIGFGYGYNDDNIKVDVRLEDLIDPDGADGDEKSNAAKLLDQISDLYIAYFGRAPDAKGFTYWFKEIYTESHSFEDAASAFSFSQEYRDAYPAGSSNRDFVEAVYQNLFTREPDTDGWDYWEGRLNEGLARDVFLLSVINGAYAESSGDEDRDLLGNKHDVSVYYAEQSALHPEEDFDDAINTLLNDVTGDDATEVSAKAVIDYAFANDVTLSGIMADQELLDQIWG